jgi:Polyketide cyclase / dehydrase and lipid transport
VALITQTQVIDAPIDRVFDTVIDVGNYAAWNPTITASRRLDEGELRDGSRFEWQLKGFGVGASGHSPACRAHDRAERTEKSSPDRRSAALRLPKRAGWADGRNRTGAK